jgi:alkanesulfonate monooxygenase SsuD/methylene tetrahydromethanopterin reductase-like flavin-dependent oxidoreductase (luciferase family)
MGEIRLMARVDTCVHPIRQAAYDGIRPMIARFLATSYPDRSFVHRAGLEVPPNLEALIALRDPALVPQIARDIPEEFIPAFCWAGTPEMVAEQVASAAHATGVDEFGFWLLLAPGQTREEAIRLLSLEVLPQLRNLIPGK